jgi:hypothetical protein
MAWEEGADEVTYTRKARKGQASIRQGRRIGNLRISPYTEATGFCAVECFMET